MCLESYIGAAFHCVHLDTFFVNSRVIKTISATGFMIVSNVG